MQKLHNIIMYNICTMEMFKSLIIKKSNSSICIVYLSLFVP